MPLHQRGDAGLAPPSIDRAPASLTKLLSRLELANRLASEGYGLSGSELAELVEEPLHLLQLRSDPWVWRDWLVEPLPDGRWRLRRGGED